MRSVASALAVTHIQDDTFEATIANLSRRTAESIAMLEFAWGKGNGPAAGEGIEPGQVWTIPRYGARVYPY